MSEHIPVLLQDEPVTAYVTKYALTSGIQIVNGKVCHGINSAMLSYGSFNSAHGNDWHRTPEAAIERAEEMRKAKIRSLNKSLNKLKSIVFKIV